MGSELPCSLQHFVANIEITLSEGSVALATLVVVVTFFVVIN
jgi:hypothetical protein